MHSINKNLNSCNRMRKSFERSNINKTEKIAKKENKRLILTLASS